MRTYQNPVYPNYFADPFVWKFEGTYYAVGTGPVGPIGQARASDGTSSPAARDEMAFPLLRSADFATWELAGGALRVPEFARGGDFWAPEVAYSGEHFYLYYSVSTEGLKHQLRVAVSSRPEGPYEDAGLLMPDADACPFAIDPHPFLDDDGQWYLFYASDFLDFDGTLRAGTALVVDRLESMTRLSGKPVTVLRAKCDWQLFKANRSMYGRVFDWHTLEGPCVRKRGGRYYCFYSGGCFENESYGVDYGVADSILGPYSDAGNESGPRFLKTVPEQVIGPGHHSIVLGPDSVIEYVAYHAWNRELTSRRMFMDKLVWSETGPICLGPTWTPQTLPG
jgi:beta-xylosidase